MDQAAQMFRRAAHKIHQSLVQKPLTETQFWPLWGDKKVSSDKIIMTREMYELIKKAHNLN